MIDFFDYAEANGLALFPVPFGRKEDLGWKPDERAKDSTLKPIVWRWSQESTKDRAQWQAWHDAHQCNFAFDLAKSDCVGLDLDVSGDPDIWRKFCAFWKERGIAPPIPQFKSARDGWHVLVRAPEGVDVGSMGQPDLMPNINIRTAGYLIAPESWYDGSTKGQASGYYKLVADAPGPHVRPDVFARLIDVCGTKGGSSKSRTAKTGTATSDADVDLSLMPLLDEVVARVQHAYDVGAVSKDAAEKWVRDPDAHAGCKPSERAQRDGNGYFAFYAQWSPMVGAIKALYGEAARSQVAVLMSRNRTVNKMFESAWASKAPAAAVSYSVLKKFFSASNSLGFDDGGRYRKAKVAAVFASFNSIAAVAGAVSPPAGSTSMVAGATQAKCDLGAPIIAAFNAAHFVAHAIDAPVFPLGFSAASLRGPLMEAIGKLYTLADRDRASLQFDIFGELLGVLGEAHEMTLAPVVARIRSTGVVVPENKLKRAVKAFSDDVKLECRLGDGWALDRNNIKPDPWVSENVDVLLSRIDTDLRFNVFARQKEFSRDSSDWRPLTDDDVSAISCEARSKAHMFNVAKSHLEDSLTTIARRRTYDPLLDYIDSLQWDGVPRLDTWLSNTCGVPTDAYHMAVARNVIGGMVRRARHPGCKHDTTMLLISPKQGTGKSTLARYLVPDEMWFSDSVNLKLSPQNLLPTLDGMWVVEWAELASMRKTEVEDVKAFLTRQADNYTKKFDKIAGNHPRRYIFIATSNDLTPLRDDTGNRRFLPVVVRGDIDLDWLQANRDALIAEAAHRDAAGETFAVPKEVWDLASQHQEAARASTPMETLIDDWFSTPGQFWVCATDLTEALRHHGIRDNRIGKACDHAGLDSVRFAFDGVPQARAWAKADTVVTHPRVRLVIDGGVVKWKWPPLATVRMLPVAPPPY